MSLCGYFIKKYVKHNQQEKELKQQQVSVVAKLCLQKAEAYKQKNDKILFYDAIAIATSGYLQQKYKIPNMSADFENLIECMHEKNVSEHLVTKFVDLQKKCHLARFAGVYGDMDEVFTMSGSWISEMEKMELK